jgi:hypothetical protein
MSNQNRKAKVRLRMAKTGAKYTQASRELSAGESLESEGLPESPLLRTACEVCSECGGAVRWVRAIELEGIRPNEYAELLRVWGPLEQDAQAWVCLECNNFGVFCNEVFGGDWSELDADLDACLDCQGGLEWVDPAVIATRDRERYMEAKRRYGAAAVLEGAATVCRGCGQVVIHPGPHPGAQW